MLRPKRFYIKNKSLSHVFSVIVQGVKVKETTVPNEARKVANKHLNKGIKSVYILTRRRK